METALDERYDMYDERFVRDAFADMETALQLERGDAPAPPRVNSVCPNCDNGILIYSGSGGHPGSAVCGSCGCVLDGLVLYGQMYGIRLTTRHSNYKRIHHFHERISQLLLLETQIPSRDMLAIAECFKESGYTTLNKATVRAVLRSLKKQTWIERWLQIVHRLSGFTPPPPGPQLVQALDSLFVEIQDPFEKHKPAGRTNMLNYNYVFHRLLQKLGCVAYCKFFPIIKSKSKLEALDGIWAEMCSTLNWRVEPLKPVPEFSVQVSASQLESRLTCLRLAGEECPVSKAVPVSRGPRAWDLYQRQLVSKKRRQQVRSMPNELRARALGKMRRLPRPRKAA